MGSQQSSPEEMSRGLDIAKKLIKDHSIVVFSWTKCPYCVKAKNYLTKAGANFHVEEWATGTKSDTISARLAVIHNTWQAAIELDKRSDGDAIKDALKEHITGCETVPQVFIHGKFIGGGNDTEAKFKSGELQKLIADKPPSPKL